MANQEVIQPMLRQDGAVNETTHLLDTAPPNEPYSEFTSAQKRVIILTAALA